MLDLNFVLVGGGSISRQFQKFLLKQNIKFVLLSRSNDLATLNWKFTDVTDERLVAEAVDYSISCLSKIDVVINFSGVHHQVLEVGTNSLEDFLDAYNHCMDVNVKGAMLITAAFGETLISQRSGHLIHFCSNASNLSLYGSHAYTISKHALVGLIKSFATQFARHGVRINGIAPGTVETPLNRHLLRDSEGNLGPRAKSILSHTPSKRFIDLEGIVESLWALSVPQRHLTGNVIYCDDGYNVEGHSWPEGNLKIYEH